MVRHGDSPSNVIGLCSTGHGAAVALVSARHGVRALTLDRFTGHKHSLLFTRRELEDITGAATPIDRQIFEALDYSYGRFPRALVIEEAFAPFLRSLLRGLPIGPRDVDLVVTSDCHFGFNRGRVGDLLRCFFPNAEIVHDLEHHAIHQWQAFLQSGFTAAAVLTVDESGEALGRLGGRKVSMSLSLARGREVEVMAEHTHPRSSPGLLYGIVSRHLGYYAGEEGKTMGLAAYGGDAVYRRLAGDLRLFGDGSFAFLAEDELLGRLQEVRRRRQPGEPVEPIHADIAYAGQRLLEDVLRNAVAALGRQVPSAVGDLCLAGGTALNSSANEKLFRASRFERIYICPNPGDDGHSLGCALYGARILRREPGPEGVADDYLGPPYTDREIAAALDRRSLTAPAASPDEVAALLAAGRTVAVYQGGSEYGPRALGNRSILADPRRAETRDLLNERVKHRENFRPYAPVVLEEQVGDWFDHDGPSRFMLRVVPVRPDRRELLGAVTHVDGSARIQTVDRRTNPRLYAIVEAFGRQTGVPVLLNTSFNVSGRPIVETPDDAVECFLDSGLDALLAGDRLVVKPAVPPADLAPEERRARQERDRLVAHLAAGASAEPAELLVVR